MVHGGFLKQNMDSKANGLCTSRSVITTTNHSFNVSRVGANRCH